MKYFCNCFAAKMPTNMLPDHIYSEVWLTDSLVMDGMRLAGQVTDGRGLRGLKLEICPSGTVACWATGGTRPLRPGDTRVCQILKCHTNVQWQEDLSTRSHLAAHNQDEPDFQSAKRLQSLHDRISIPQTIITNSIITQRIKIPFRLIQNFDDSF